MSLILTTITRYNYGRMPLIVTTITTSMNTKYHSNCAPTDTDMGYASVSTHPFRSPSIDDLSTMIQAEPQHSFLSPKHTVQRPVVASISIYGKRFPDQHSLTAQHLPLTRSSVVGHDSTVLAIGHIESVLGGAEGQLVRDEETSVVNGILPCLKELATRTELENTAIAVAVW